jgi:predicted phage tail protein
MNTTAHPVAPEDVMALLDGELSAAEAQAVSAHLDRCAECSALAEQLRTTSLSLSRWNVEAVSAKLKDSIKDRTAKTGSGLKIGKANLFIRASFWTWRQWAFASAGTLAALLLVSAISLSNLHRSGGTAKSQAVDYKGWLQSERESSDKGSAGKPQVVTTLADPGEITHQQLKMSGRQITQQNSPPVAATAPGVAADSTGNFHGLGDHAEKSFSVHGQPVTDQQDEVTSGPMIARRVSLSIVVKDFAASRSSLDGILARHHGYSAQLNVSTPENAARGLEASLRIPAPELASAVADLKTLGRVENESQSGEEVTQEHADLVARLKNSRETEQRLRTILEERTGKVVEVLQVEQEIARVRGDIERMEAEQKALEHRVDFATVDLQLTEEYKAQLNPPAASVSTRIRNALVAGYRDASEMVLGIVLFFAESGPTLLIWLVIIVLPIIFVWRRYRRALGSA